ncbi:MULTISPECIES: hypothetical protein [Paenibacillus]|uniref:hypothetical protein n=1 Tax=Paenibacillus sp. FSL F4-0100 TaxID=2921370 RepID=UPI0015C3F72C|nr:hypothetical protein [Paenibacillus lautus]
MEAKASADACPESIRPPVSYVSGSIEAKLRRLSAQKTCTKAQGDREVTVSLKYLRYKQQAREISQ